MIHQESAGQEVHVVLEGRKRGLVGVEVKAGTTRSCPSASGSGGADRGDVGRAAGVMGVCRTGPRHLTEPSG